MTVFDSSGYLILPRGAIEEFRKEKQLNKARYPTGIIYVSKRLMKDFPLDSGDQVRITVTDDGKLIVEKL